MLRFLAQRLVGMAAVLLAMSFVIYGLMGLMPGDPVDLMVASDPHLTSADAERLRAYYGLDRPVLLRYGSWLADAAQGEFGYSRDYKLPVEQVLAPRLVNTLWLVGGSLILALALAVPLGVLAAMKQGRWPDHAVNFFCFAGISVPPFWLGMMAILVFSVKLGWFPASGVFPPGAEESLALRLRHLALPLACLTFLTLGDFIRFVRAALVEEMDKDYMRTARAKGLSPLASVLCHALRNALIPVATVAALSFGTVFSGALVTEQVFSYLGTGKLIFDAINTNDFNLAMLALMLAAGLVLIANLLADLAYAALDPRIGFGRSA
jgi:peptide/nickel transport system permease protein